MNGQWWMCIDADQNGDKYSCKSCGLIVWVDKDGMPLPEECPRCRTTQEPAIRTFETGATRGEERNKLDYEGFLSPLVVERFAQYMDKHRTQADGHRRESDNWQKGMPKVSYMKSGWRHFFDWWKEHRGLGTKEGLEDAICALIFNAQGYLHEHLKQKLQK